MNYYIQGNKDKAEQIKAAFERLGCKNTNCFKFDEDERLYFSFNGKIDWSCYKPFINIIKTHPDYKELELPIEFKDGDIIGFNDCTHNDGSYIDWVGIYRHQSNDFINHQHFFHCVATSKTFRIGGSWRVFTAYPATKEQRDLLFAKMKEAGYQWNVDKKELRKIQPHYDIANFHAGMPVLVRDDNGQEWNYLHFSHYRKKLPDHFFAGGNPWEQCIPFEGNEHLLGTTDMCDEMYVNW